MEFKFNINEIFKEPTVEINQNLIPPGFKGDRRALWDTVMKVSEVINAMGEASAAAQGLTKTITSAERLRNSENQKLYFLIDRTANNGKGAVTGMLKVGRKGLYLFDNGGRYYQVSPPCVLDFYVHESRQRHGLGKQLFEHMLQNEQVPPLQMALDRPSEKLLNFLDKYYSLNKPIKQMNNYVVFEGFFPETHDEPESDGRRSATLDKKFSANGLQSSPAYGRYGPPRPPSCSMGQIIHNQTSALNSSSPVGVQSLPATNYQRIPSSIPEHLRSQSTPNYFVNSSVNATSNPQQMTNQNAYPGYAEPPNHVEPCGQIPMNNSNGTYGQAIDGSQMSPQPQLTTFQVQHGYQNMATSQHQYKQAMPQERINQSITQQSPALSSYTCQDSIDKQQNIPLNQTIMETPPNVPNDIHYHSFHNVNQNSNEIQNYDQHMIPHSSKFMNQYQVEKTTTDNTLPDTRPLNYQVPPEEVQTKNSQHQYGYQTVQHNRSVPPQENNLYAADRARETNFAQSANKTQLVPNSQRHIHSVSMNPTASNHLPPMSQNQITNEHTQHALINQVDGSYVVGHVQNPVHSNPSPTAIQSAPNLSQNAQINNPIASTEGYKINTGHVPSVSQNNSASMYDPPMVKNENMLEIRKEQSNNTLISGIPSSQVSYGVSLNVAQQHPTNMHAQELQYNVQQSDQQALSGNILPSVAQNIAIIHEQTSQLPPYSQIPETSQAFLNHPNIPLMNHATSEIMPKSFQNQHAYSHPSQIVRNPSGSTTQISDQNQVLNTTAPYQIQNFNQKPERESHYQNQSTSLAANQITANPNFNIGKQQSSPEMSTEQVQNSEQTHSTTVFTSSNQNRNLYTTMSQQFYQPPQNRKSVAHNGLPEISNYSKTAINRYSPQKPDMAGDYSVENRKIQQNQTNFDREEEEEGILKYGYPPQRLKVPPKSSVILHRS